MCGWHSVTPASGTGDRAAARTRFERVPTLVGTLCKIQATVVQLESEPLRGTVGARLLLVDEIDRPRVRRGR